MSDISEMHGRQFDVVDENGNCLSTSSLRALALASLSTLGTLQQSLVPAAEVRRWLVHDMTQELSPIRQPAYQTGGRLPGSRGLFSFWIFFLAAVITYIGAQLDILT